MKSSEELIQKVRSGLEGRNEVIKELYQNEEYKKTIIGTLVKMGCASSKASDYHVDSIVTFVKSCYKPDFEIKSSLKSYLVGIAKNIWLKEVTKERQLATINKDYDQSDEFYLHELTLTDTDRPDLLNQLLNQLDDTCKEVLQRWAVNEKMRVIAQAMNYKSEGMVRKKKHQCLKRLYDIVGQNKSIVDQLRDMI